MCGTSNSETGAFEVNLSQPDALHGGGLSFSFFRGNGSRLDELSISQGADASHLASQPSNTQSRATHATGGGFAGSKKNNVLQLVPDLIPQQKQNSLSCLAFSCVRQIRWFKRHLVQCRMDQDVRSYIAEIMC